MQKLLPSTFTSSPRLMLWTSQLEESERQRDACVVSLHLLSLHSFDCFKPSSLLFTPPPHPSSGAAPVTSNCLWYCATTASGQAEDRDVERAALLRYKTRAHSEVSVHACYMCTRLEDTSPTCTGCMQTLPHLPICYRERVSSCGPDGPSHAADRPTLLDPCQPGSALTAPIQT